MQSKSQFSDIFLLGGGYLEVGVVQLTVLDRLSRATNKKGRQLFEEKSAHMVAGGYPLRARIVGQIRSI